jgi:hypothetical protein
VTAPARSGRGTGAAIVAAGVAVPGIGLLLDPGLLAIVKELGGGVLVALLLLVVREFSELRSAVTSIGEGLHELGERVVMLEQPRRRPPAPRKPGSSRRARLRRRQARRRR